MRRERERERERERRRAGERRETETERERRRESKESERESAWRGCGWGKTGAEDSQGHFLNGCLCWGQSSGGGPRALAQLPNSPPRSGDLVRRRRPGNTLWTPWDTRHTKPWERLAPPLPPPLGGLDALGASAAGSTPQGSHLLIHRAPYGGRHFGHLVRRFKMAYAMLQ